MDHSTLMGDRLAQRQQQEMARTLELRRRIAERREAVQLETAAPEVFIAKGVEAKDLAAVTGSLAGLLGDGGWNTGISSCGRIGLTAGERDAGSQ